MRLVAHLFLLAAAATAAQAALAGSKNDWKTLFVKWASLGLWDKVMGDAYFNLPLTTADAINENWVQAASNELYSTWCLPGDPRVCVWHDMKGNVCGMQVCVPLADVANTPYSLDQHKFFTRRTLMDMELYCGELFLVDQDTLKAGGRLSAVEPEMGNGLWFRKGDELVQVARNEDELADYWTKEDCFLTMGRHYYYNMSQDMPCENFEPFFLLTNPYSKRVHGAGFQVFGHPSQKAGGRNWMEDVPSAAIKKIVPNSPQCLTDWADLYGIISLHIYFAHGPFACIEHWSPFSG